tara:strand:- start:267 stop:482 length:216 start_codon:yes stop_codon:yes gene_type:complete
MSEVYEYVDEELKREENCLTVDLFFDGEVTLREANIILDSIMKRARADGDYKTFIGYRPTIYTKHPFVLDD